MSTRVRLISMENEPDAPPPGTLGTVISVDSIGTVHVKWDNGSTLGLVLDVDNYEEVEEPHECEGDNCSLCPRCYQTTGRDVCAYTCDHDNGYAKRRPGQVWMHCHGGFVDEQYMPHCPVCQ